MSDVTRILNALEQGDLKAADALLPLVYEELRLLAARKLHQEPPGQTLQATALVHEVYLRLVGEQNQNWSSRAHFFRAAAEAMRRILIDNARRKKSLKRGGPRRPAALDESPALDDTRRQEEMLALDEALARLDAEDPVQADVVKLRYFAGLTVEQTAQVLGISATTVKLHWAYARAWLLREIGD
ncbi:MAG: sigma-70 family RNA polymerase sigma factor [Planctomycetes bacterium]|nr:sigma-70 family RNA polymerase sigma factor [Planctomycetota bacterium]